MKKVKGKPAPAGDAPSQTILLQVIILLQYAYMELMLKDTCRKRPTPWLNLT